MRPQHTHAARNQAFFGCLNPHQEINLEHRTAVYFLRRSNKWARPTNKKAWTEGKWLKGCVWQRATKEIGHFGVQNSHFENEAKCETFVVKMSFICMRVKIIFLSLAHLHLNLALKQRLEATRNRPICKRQSLSSSSSPHHLHCYYQSSSSSSSSFLFAPDLALFIFESQTSWEYPTPKII